MAAKNVLYMLKHCTHRQMQSFIIKEESGKILVIDGGWTEDGPYLLKKLHLNFHIKHMVVI